MNDGNERTNPWLVAIIMVCVVVILGALLMSGWREKGSGTEMQPIDPAGEIQEGIRKEIRQETPSQDISEEAGPVTVTGYVNVSIQ